MELWRSAQCALAARDASADSSIESLLMSVSAVLFAIRKAKSDARQSLKASVARVELVDRAAQLEMIKGVRQDVIEAGQVEALAFIEGTEQQVGVWLK